MAEQIELFGIARRLPEITIPGGELGVNELRELIHDESLQSLFKFVGEELEITLGQFFAGCRAIQPQRGRRVIGYVRMRGMLWTFSRNGTTVFEADAPGVSHKGRNPGDLVLSPALQPPISLPVLPVTWSHLSTHF